MKNKKKIIIILFVIIVLISSIGFISYNNILKEYNYNDAKKQCIKLLNKNISEFVNLSEKAIDSNSTNINKYKKYNYKLYHDKNNKEYVKFNIDSQGMLGGQYWGIIYSPNDDYLDEENKKVYNESEERDNGNNVIIYEKIRENWYFFYEDYDGRKDLDCLN